jgi:NAD(P)-dependent dehydrogenase (short-subunit alcohol dehydrogenase family)
VPQGNFLKHIEYARQNIRVNAICQPMIPLGRLSEVKNIARPIVWVCSEDASSMTDHIMNVDGGVASHG